MPERNSRGELTPDYNQTDSSQVERKLSQNELNKAKRKSNAYMAAEAVQQERDAVTALKRLSIGRSSINVDPDLPYGVDGDFNYNDYSKKNVHHRRNSSQESTSSRSSSSLAEDDKEKTLIDEDENDITRVSQDSDQDHDINDENVRLNAEKLLWVPAKSHPNIAPDQFRRHVQSTIDDMNHRLGEKSPMASISTRDSIPSLKELTDELDRLSEMAGLAATDAVTLARSLSSASGSSSLLLDKDENRFFQERPARTPSSPTSTTTDEDRPVQEDVDQDAPVLSDGSSSLRRNKWTTYSRSHRGAKDKPKPTAKSPLADEHKFVSQQQPSIASTSSPKLDKELPPSPPKEIPSRSVPLQDPKEQQKLADQSRGRNNQLSRSHSDPAAATAIQPHKRTNHSRNRHAGSLITIDGANSSLPAQNHSHQQLQQSSTKPLYQRRVVSNDPNPYQRQQNNNQPSLQDIQKTRPLPHNPQQQQQQQLQQLQSSQQKPVPHPPSQQEQQQQQQIRSSNQRSISDRQLPPQHASQPSRDAPVEPISKDYGTTSSLQSGQSTSPSTSPSSLTFPSSQTGSPEKPEKSKKDNSFLKMFKKKRSPSPKNQESLIPSIASKTLPTSINDENKSPTSTQFDVPVSPEKKPQQQNNQQRSPPQQKRPTLKPSRSSQFKFSKSSKHDRDNQEKSGPKPSSKLQESVTIVPKRKSGDQHQQLQQQHSQRELQQTSPESPQTSPPQSEQQHQSLDPKNQQQYHQQTGQALNEEQHRIQKETLSKKLSLENMKKSSKPNAPVQFTDSAFGFPLPPLSHSTLIMLDYRFPIHVERALYRLSHLKLANPRRQLRQQVLLSNFMYSYLNLVNHTLYLQQLDENQQEEMEDEVVVSEGQSQINIEV